MGKRRYQPPKPGRTFKVAGQEPEPTEAYRQACKIRSSKAWRDVRQMVIQRHPICQWCGKQPASEGHHIAPVAECPELALVADNVLAVCKECHELVESAVRRGVDINKLMEG